jgi:hypothetical protein
MSDTTPQPDPNDPIPDTLAIAIQEVIDQSDQTWAHVTGDRIAAVVRDLWQEGLIHQADLDVGSVATCWLCQQGISMDTDQRSDENGSFHTICLDAYWDAETLQIRAAFERLTKATVKFDGVIGSKPYTLHPSALRAEKDRLLRVVDGVTDNLLERADDIHDRSRLGHDGPAGGQTPTS